MAWLYFGEMYTLRHIYVLNMLILCTFFPLQLFANTGSIASQDIDNDRVERQDLELFLQEIQAQIRADAQLEDGLESKLSRFYHRDIQKNYHSKANEFNGISTKKVDESFISYLDEIRIQHEREFDDYESILSSSQLFEAEESRLSSGTPSSLSGISSCCRGIGASGKRLTGNAEVQDIAGFLITSFDSISLQVTRSFHWLELKSYHSWRQGYVRRESPRVQKLLCIGGLLDSYLLSNSQNKHSYQALINQPTFFPSFLPKKSFSLFNNHFSQFLAIDCSVSNRFCILTSFAFRDYLYSFLQPCGSGSKCLISHPYFQTPSNFKSYSPIAIFPIRKHTTANRIAARVFRYTIYADFSGEIRET